jgi:hypothetical protein
VECISLSRSPRAVKDHDRARTGGSPQLTDLSERFEEESKKRAQDEDEKLMIEFFLFFLAVYLQLFLWMIGAPPLGL